MEFGPPVGSEPAKNRPALVLSVRRLAHLPTRLVVPLTTWRQQHENQWNKVFVQRDDGNQLDIDPQPMSRNYAWSILDGSENGSASRTKK